jgi:hypothetical protein
LSFRVEGDGGERRIKAGELSSANPNNHPSGVRARRGGVHEILSTNASWGSALSDCDAVTLLLRSNRSASRECSTGGWGYD